MSSTETNTAPLVSIVIPAYNHAPYLAETIESVLRQTYSQWELIILDDGSTDDTPAIIQHYRDPRLRTFRHDNRGLSATLNRGVALAQGKYFAFLPSDDVYEIDKLAVQVKVLEEHPTVGVVFSRQTVIDAQGQPTAEKQVQAWFEVPFTTKEEIFPALFERDFLSTPTHLLRMECFARVGLFDESLVTTQDYDLWLRILRYYDICLLPQSLVRMRWHEYNQTRNATPQTEQERATVLLKAFRALSIEEIFPSLVGIDRQIYPEAFARAYLTLARYAARNSLVEMIPVARLYLTQALACGTGLSIPEELQPLLQTSPGLQQLSMRREVEPDEDDRTTPLPATTEQPERPFFASLMARSERINVIVEVATLDKGGFENVVFSMVTGLPREVFRLLIVCVEQGGMTAERCRRDGIPVEILSGDKESAYQEILRRFHADLVVSHYSPFGLPIAAQLSIPVISFVHGLYAWFHEGILGEMGTWDQYVSRYVAVSHDIAHYLIHRFHIAQDKICVIPNGVEIVSTQEGETKADRAQWGLGPEDYVFLNVAAISPTKGHCALLEALRSVVVEYPNVKVLCAGSTLDEAYHQKVLEKRRQLQFEEQYLFIGFQAEVALFYRMADAFVLPSVLEGFGLVKLEAMAHGLPLILTRIGDSDRLIENSDIGLIVPNTYGDLYNLDLTSVIAHLADETPTNVADLATAMTEFVAHQEHWQIVGQHGREKVLRAFTKERTLKSYEAMFVREVWLARKRRSEDELRYENIRLRTQVRLLEQLVKEKTQTAQEKNGLLQEKTLVVQEKDRNLREQEQRLAELSRSTGQQQAQIAALQHLTTQQLQDLQRLSLTIFDRLDLTKRIRTLRTRLLRGIWSRLPQLMKKPAKSVFVLTRKMRETRKERRYSSRNVFLVQLRAILAQHKRAREIILFAPSVHWNLPLFQRPHQLALAFARSDCLVFFCEPAYSEDYTEGFHPISQGLYVANAPIELFREIESPVVIVLSYNLFDLGCLRNARCVYDYIDELAAFPGDRRTLEQNHQTLLRSATLVVATAKRLWH